MTKPDFLRLMQRLCVNYDRKPLIDRKAEVWYEKLRVYSERQLSRAVEWIIETQERFPALSILLSTLVYQTARDAQMEEILEVDRARERYHEHPPDPGYVHDSIEICRSAGWIGREAYYRAMIDMDERWSGRGWRDAAEECMYRRRSMCRRRSDSVASAGDMLEDLPF